MKNIKNLIASVLLTISFTEVIVCQTTATTTQAQVVIAPNGRKVILNPDGTWQYQKELDAKIDPSKAEMRTLAEVKSDRISFIDKPVRVAGTLRPSSFYFGLFKDSEITHFAFDLMGNGASAYLYMERGEKANEIRQKMLASNGALEGYFDIVLTQKGFEATKTVQAFVGELLVHVYK